MKWLRIGIQEKAIYNLIKIKYYEPNTTTIRNAQQKAFD